MNISSTYKLFNQTKLFFVFVFVFLILGTGNVSGQISTLKPWAFQYNGNSANTQNITYTIPVGSNAKRLLVVAIASTTQAASTRTVTLTYGGRALSPIDGDIASNNRQHTQFYYLNESGLAAASGTTLSFAVSGGTTVLTTVFAGVYDNVDQMTPITDSRNYNSGTTTPNTFAFASGLSINTDDLALKILCSIFTGNTTIPTINYFATNWTVGVQQTGTLNLKNLVNDLGIKHAVGTRTVTSTNITDVSTTTMDLNTLISMTGVSLKCFFPKYFQSLKSGNWNDITTWQESTNNSTWTAATSIPTSFDNLVTVLNGHKVTLTANASASSLSINGNGTVDLSNFILTGTGNLTVASTGSLIVGGAFPTGFTPILSSGSTVNYDNAGAQSISGQTYSNLIISGGGAKTLSSEVTISGTLTLTSGLLTLGAYSLTMGVSSPAIVGAFSASNMIVGDGAGELRKLFSVFGSYFFPIGETTITPEYSPVNVNFTKGTCAIDAYVGVNVHNKKHDNNLSATNYLKRYWTITGNGITAFSYTVTGTYLSTDIVGDELKSIAARNNGSTQWIKYNTLGTNTLTATDVTSFGDFTGVNDLPIITTAGTLPAFSYLYGSGPSVDKPFTVSGVDLNTNITILASSNIEISTGTANAFVPSNLLTVKVIGEVVSPAQPINVRLKAGLPIGTYKDTITCLSEGAVTKLVYSTGTVNGSANIITSSTLLSSFNYIIGDGPSAQQTLTVSGSTLAAPIIITPPKDYEISTIPGAGFVASPSITIQQIGGVAASTPIYVRLKAGLSSAYYDQETISLTSTGALTKNVTCSGIVYTPTVVASTTGLGGFIYTAGSGLPSSEQWFTFNGIHLTNDITVTPSANFEISTTSGSGFQLTPITFTKTGESVDTKTIYIRLKAGLPLGTYSGESIVLTSDGATTRSVACSGASVVNTNTIVTSVPSLVGISYTLNSGPSAPQSFTTSATSLGTNLLITATTNFEISLNLESGFTSNSITLTPSAGNIPATLIYVRLKEGITPAQTINAEYVTLVSAGAVTQQVACSGAVYNGPIIHASGGGITCIGSSISLSSSGSNYDNLSWNGPNDFHSTLPAPTITSPLAVNNGTYKVTVNGTSKINLVTNGDFELGNTGFTSIYTYRDSTYVFPGPHKALWGEGTYSVCAIPKSVHENFSSWPDHSNPGKYQMVVNGADKAGVVIWSQSVNVTPNTDYQFSYWEQTVVETAPSELQLYVNGIPSGDPWTAPSAINQWAMFFYNFNSTSNTVANLELINKNITAGGNDFALDDIVFQKVISVSDSVTVTVNPKIPVSVTIVASATTVFEGTPVTFTATPVNGGVTPLYQWMFNGAAIVGATSVTYTSSTLITGDKITCVLTSSETCKTGDPFTSNTITMTVTTRTNYWVGTESVYWSNPKNWSAGFVPVAGDDVVYASTTNSYGSNASKDLQLDGDRTIGSLVNRTTTRKLIIPAGFGLIVNNNIVTNGDANLIQIKSDPLANHLLANGSLIFHNPSNLPVNATVEMYSKAYFNPSGIKNQSKYNWQYFGIPIENYPALPTFYHIHVRRWVEAGSSTANHWVGINNEDIVQAFYGYEICPDSTFQNVTKTYVFQGSLVNRNFSSGKLAFTPSALFSGQHVFANPYTAAIDIRQLTFGPNTEATVFMYNTGTFGSWSGYSGGTTPGNNPGQYTAVPKSNAGYNQIPRQVPSMQAMLVKAMGDFADATFDINYNSVAMISTDPQRVSASDGSSSSNKVGIIIDVKGDHFSDRMWLFSDPGYTRGFDNGYDGQKMLGSALAPQLFAIEADGVYQVNSVPDLHDTELGFQAGQDANYTLTFTHQNIEKQYAGLYLVDLVDNKTIDITASGTTYTFMAESTPTTVKRFRIVTRAYEKNAPDFESQLKVFSSQESIFVQNNSELNGVCAVYDIAGNYIKKMPFSANGVTTITNTLKPGAYIVKAITGNEKISKRLIVR